MGFSCGYAFVGGIGVEVEKRLTTVLQLITAVDWLTISYIESSSFRTKRIARS